MLIPFLLISVVFITIGIILSRYEAKKELQERRDYLKSRARYLKRSGRNN